MSRVIKSNGSKGKFIGRSGSVSGSNDGWMLYARLYESDTHAAKRMQAVEVRGMSRGKL